MSDIQITIGTDIRVTMETDISVFERALEVDAGDLSIQEFIKQTIFEWLSPEEPHLYIDDYNFEVIVVDESTVLLEMDFEGLYWFVGVADYMKNYDPEPRWDHTKEAPLDYIARRVLIEKDYF